MAINSVSNLSNQPIVALMARMLEPVGFHMLYFPYRDEAGVEKINVAARIGPVGEPALALVAHTDTVPFDAAWSGALDLEKRGEAWYGRGSADTKSGLAAMMVAASQVDPSRLIRPLMIIGTADEEVGCKGAKRLVVENQLHPQYAIIAEPTRLIPIRGHKGYCVDEVEVRGREGHSAYPHVGHSAILDAARVLAEIQLLGVELEADQDATFEPPFTTLNVGTISGGKARNVIPGLCSFPLEWRPLPRQPLEHVHDQFMSRLSKLAIEVEVTPSRRDPGVSTAMSSPLVQFLQTATGLAVETVAFGTELPYLTRLGAQACVIGPGDIRVAHRTDEFVPDADLDAAVRLYRQAIEHFCC